MQSVISKTITMKKDGTLVMPKAILDLYEITDDTKIEIRLMANGTIEITPLLDVPKSFYLQANPQLLETVARPYADAKNKR